MAPQRLGDFLAACANRQIGGVFEVQLRDAARLRERLCERLIRHA